MYFCMTQDIYSCFAILKEKPGTSQISYPHKKKILVPTQKYHGAKLFSFAQMLKEGHRVRLPMLVVVKIFVAIYVLLEIAHINYRRQIS